MQHLNNVNFLSRLTAILKRFGLKNSIVFIYFIYLSDHHITDQLLNIILLHLDIPKGFLNKTIDHNFLHLNHSSNLECHCIFGLYLKRLVKIILQDKIILAKISTYTSWKKLIHKYRRGQFTHSMQNKRTPFILWQM